MKAWLTAALLLGIACSAFAAQDPTVTSPRDGQVLGTSVEVVGKAEPHRVVIILTDVYVNGREQPVGTVPGSRGWTEEDGSFALRIATPRVRNARDADITYKIRVFTQLPGHKPGPETVITCRAAE